MSRTISVLYRDANDEAAEHIFGDESTEAKARAFAHRKQLESATDIVMRCTYPDATNPHILHTAWAESFNDAPDATPDPESPFRSAINDLIVYTIPELLTTVQRAIIRGETLTAEWFERTLTDLDRDLSAVL